MTTHPSPSPAGPGAATPAIGVGQRIALLVLLTASFTLALDFSILNVALPRIGAEVGFALADLQWISTAFAVCAAGFTLLFGRLADLFGRRRQFLVGIALLGAASLLGGLAGEPWLLLVARVAQGIATAAVTPAALSLLTTSFPEGAMRDRALGSRARTPCKRSASRPHREPVISKDHEQETYYQDLTQKRIDRT